MASGFGTGFGAAVVAEKAAKSNSIAPIPISLF